MTCVGRAMNVALAAGAGQGHVKVPPGYDRIVGFTINLSAGSVTLRSTTTGEMLLDSCALVTAFLAPVRYELGKRDETFFIDIAGGSGNPARITVFLEKDDT